LYKLSHVAVRVPSPELLTIKAAAELLGVSEQTLRRWDDAGKLRAKRHPMNGYRLYPREQVLELKRRIYSEVDEAK
jgi:excisionase family DNA binding protein